MQHKTPRVISSLIIASFLILQTASLVVAQDKTSTGSGTTTTSDLGVGGLLKDLNKQATASAEAKGRGLAQIIARADSLITERITKLNSLLSRVQNDARLTDSEKADFSSQVQAAITGLNSLKTKIDADTDPATALADAKQIFSNYRIYAMFEPKMNLLVTLNNMQTVVNNVSILMPKLQNFVNSLSANGKDVSGITPLLADINTQLSSASTNIANDIIAVQAVNLNTPDPQSVFKAVRDDIQNVVRINFTKIRSDIFQMRSLLRTIIGSSATPVASGTSAASSSPVPTATP